jgi:hypothetical protein
VGAGRRRAGTWARKQGVRRWRPSVRAGGPRRGSAATRAEGAGRAGAARLGAQARGRTAGTGGVRSAARERAGSGGAGGARAARWSERACGSARRRIQAGGAGARWRGRAEAWLGSGAETGQACGTRASAAGAGTVRRRAARSVQWRAEWPRRWVEQRVRGGAERRRWATVARSCDRRRRAEAGGCGACGARARPRQAMARRHANTGMIRQGRSKRGTGNRRRAVQGDNVQGNGVQDDGVQRIAVFSLDELRPRLRWCAGRSHMVREELQCDGCGRIRTGTAGPRMEDVGSR